MTVDEQIKEFIKNLPNLTDEELITNYKIASSKGKPYDKILSPIDKERRSRGTVTTISSKSPKLNSNPTADAYEGVEVVPTEPKD